MIDLVRQPNWFAAILFLVGGLAGCPEVSASAWGAEPVDQFLDALRSRRYYDEALDYLDLLGKESQLPAALEQRLLYEQGVTLVESAAGQSDPKGRETLLATAAERFRKFQEAHPEHELSGSAKLQLANILIERGRGEIQRAGHGEESAAAMGEARRWFEQAREQFVVAEKELDGRLQKLPKLIAPEETALKAQKNQVAGDLAQARLYRAGVDFELSKTHPAESAEAKKLLHTSARAYATLSETYRTRAAGLLARLWEGRCHQELGEMPQALGCFRELIDMSANAETRSLRAKSTRHAMECLTSKTEKKYQEAIERGERWEKEAGTGQLDADTLAIRYLTAVAYQGQSNTLPAKDPNRKKLVGIARQTVSPVAQNPGEYQRPAKLLLVALAAPKEKDSKKSGGGQSVTFAEALESARESLGKMQDAIDGLKDVKDSNSKAAKELQKQKQEHAAAAHTALRTAMEKSDAKTPVEELNSVRYYLCFLAWDAQQYYDAALLGEFLADRYPNSPNGQQGARIALAAAVQMYAESKAEDRSFEMAQIERIASIIFKRFGDREEADQAAMTLLNFAAQQQQPEKAVDFLKKISEHSPRRAVAELRAGQALWSSYLRALQAPAEERPSQEKLDALKTTAEQLLNTGVERAKSAEAVDASLATAVFTLAQIAVETGRPEVAVKWLEDDKMGPLALIKAENPVAARKEFAIETYKTALRAYIAVNPQQLQKAEAMMDHLEKVVQGSGDAKAAENLTAIYVSLGRELQKQLQELRKAGRTKELNTVSQAFEVFLDRVTKRDAGSNLSTLNWVAETYYGLGTGLEEASAIPSPKTKEYYQKANGAYQKMLAAAEKDPKYKDQPDSLISLRMRLADCQSRSGDYDNAVKTIAGVLREKPQRLSAQVQAAEIYQAHGRVDPKSYALAINGGEKDKNGRNVIWGWSLISNKLSKLALDDPKVETTFHEARLNMAEARYAYSLTQKEAERKNKVLTAAKQDLWYTYKLYPQLGGKEMSARYEREVKKIQKALGEKEIGLEEFRQRDQTAAQEKST